MAPTNFFSRAYHLYSDGFRSMTLGKTLWTIIFIKLFIIFVVLRIFFFPNFLRTHTVSGEEPTFVSKQLMDRAQQD